jgi:serine/threonine protein kinase
MDLYECIETFGHFTEPVARHIFKQIIDAVMFLHNLGIAHRDIKDENILINENLNIKLIDFGSAAFFDFSGRHKFYEFLGYRFY